MPGVYDPCLILYPALKCRHITTGDTFSILAIAKKGDTLAKTNFQYERRQKDLEKKRKKEEKLKRKADKKDGPGEEGAEGSEPDAADGDDKDDEEGGTPTPV